MVRLQAEKPFNYAGRDLAAGEEFEATDGDAFVLTSAAPPLARKLATATPPPVTPAEAQPALMEVEQPSRRRYSRRDMRAGS